MKISRRARPHTVTVYNYVGSTAGVAAYQRTVIERVYLDRAYQQRLNVRGIQTEDQAHMILDLSDFTATDSRTYTEAESWPALTTEQKALHFTFRAQDDFFVEGVAAETLPNTTKAGMQAKHRCLSVSSAAIPASGSAEPTILEVTAR